MRIFALSDIHVDYAENRSWVLNLSTQDYTDDTLILAGDISDITKLMAEAFAELGRRFRIVAFVPGNHDLWVRRNNSADSIMRFLEVEKLAQDNGLATGPVDAGGFSIVPLLGWYDYSFGELARELSQVWMDFTSCRWPDGHDDAVVTRMFISENVPGLAVRNRPVISFSHFLPRIDVMPPAIPPAKRLIYPVLGTTLLEAQVRSLGACIHVYGHSHVNRSVELDGVLYVNNAYGYPDEAHIAAKKLVCIHETD